MQKHTVISRERIPVQLARQYYGNLLKASKPEVAVAVEWIRDETQTLTLSLTDCAKALEKYAASRRTPANAPLQILEALFTLEGLRSSLGWDGKQLIEYLARDSEKDDRGAEALRDLLANYFSPSSKLERTWRAQRIYDGLTPNFDSCWSLIDFRPVFDQTRSEILNGIIVASLSIQIRETRPEVGVNPISFQLDVADIEELIEELNRMKSKIRALKNMVEERITLLNPSESLKESDEL